MKKFLFFMIAATVSMTAMSQGKGNGKGKGKHQNQSAKHENKSARQDRDDRDDRYDDDRVNKGKNKQAKIAKNIPTPVANAFYRDFPNAGNVTWTKDRGVWTANFGSGVFGSNNTVSYRANGQRVDGTYANRRTTTTGTSQTGGGLDKIFGRRGL
jgi:hypothetical protein